MMPSTTAEQGIIAWDCKYEEEIMLVPYGLFKAGDNPMQAEECSHGGLKCNLFCRTCYVGGTMVEKSTDEGYLKIFEVTFFLFYSLFHLILYYTVVREAA